MSRVVTYGTFDLLHYGHIRLLERASRLSMDKQVTVYLSTDEFSYHKKGMAPVYPYSIRKEMLLALKYVKAVYPENAWGQKEALGEDDILVMGSDWLGKFKGLKCASVFLERTEGISTSKLRGL